MVTLPTDALVQSVEGRPTSNAADAKRIACLLACQRLYEAGALTDYLLLKPDETEHPPDPTTPEESAPPATKGDFFLHGYYLDFYIIGFCVLSVR